jgi:hypothetical protein
VLEFAVDDCALTIHKVGDAAENDAMMSGDACDEGAAKPPLAMSPKP